MLDSRVHDVLVQETLGFSLTGKATPNTRVTYFVGTHGPFTLTTPSAQFSQEYVERETARQISTLENLGVIPRAS